MRCIVHAWGRYREEETTVPPEDTATRKAYLIFTGSSTTHDDTNTIPTAGDGVLNSDVLAHCELGEVLGALVVAHCDRSGSCCCTSVTVLGQGLPGIREGVRMGRKT